MSQADYRELNRKWWDERVPIHTASEFYGVDAFVEGGESLYPFEGDLVGDVTGLDLVHLQCHFGKDTLSWARRGAHVTGLDFSAPAVEAATDLAARTGIDARFVQADVYDAVEVLGETYDVVYQSVGSLSWHPDMARFAGIVDDLLRPGGRYFLVEAHPFAWILDDDGDHVQYGYFHDPAGHVWGDDSGSYADLDATTEHNVTKEFRHPVSEVIQAFVDRGLALQRFDEHPFVGFQMFPWMEEREGRTFWAPEGRDALPFMYSLLVRKPEEPAG